MEERLPLSQAEDVRSWRKLDGKVRAGVDLSLTYEHFEYVCGAKTTSEMWSSVQSLFRRCTLLINLNVRRRFCTMNMVVSARVIQYINCEKQLPTDLNAMDVDMRDEELAMTVLCRLLSKLEHLIVAIDALGADKELTLDFVKTRLLQDEQRMSDKVVARNILTLSALLRRRDNGTLDQPFPPAHTARK